jgi:HAD superfamily hydrolase (TIGR01490 family)
VDTVDLLEDRPAREVHRSDQHAGNVRPGRRLRGTEGGCLPLGILLRVSGPASPAKPATAAFFDLDKTLIPGSSLFLLARGAYDRDMIRVRDILRFARGQIMFRLIGSESHSGMDMTRESMLSFVTGQTQEAQIQMGREIAQERIIPRVYGGITSVIEGHQKRGELTFLVTAAPHELAQVVAEALEMTTAIGTQAELDEEGYYTGRLVGDIVHGPAKAEAVRKIAAGYGIDLEQSSAYSDSINDLPLLELVGDPHAVNPDSYLRRTAMARGWPIHELRTRRRALLVGIPAGIGGTAVFSAGMAAGVYIERKRQKDALRRARRQLRIRLR